MSDFALQLNNISAGGLKMVTPETSIPQLRAGSENSALRKNFLALTNNSNSIV